VTRPGGRSLILHGNDTPVPDWEDQVIPAFRLDRRELRVLFDEHERLLPDETTAVASRTPWGSPSAATPHFRRLTWEQVVGDLASGGAGNRDVDRLVRYFDGKSLGYARR
jgi:hypothetical protein